jgi:ribose transport system substrate-binding protein
MRRLTVIAVAALAALAMVACGNDSDSKGSGTSGGGPDYKIVFIPGVTGDDFFHTIWLGAQAEAQTLQVSIEQQAPPKYEPASQIPIVNAAIAKHPDAIAVAATDAEALQAPLEQAASRGIKVVTFDTTTSDPSFAVTHVSSDIVAAGREVGDELVRLTHGHGKVMYIDHAPGVNFARDLRSGFESVMNGEPGIDVLPIQYFDLEPQKANTITRTTLTGHPDLAGAFVGVGVGAQGALPALEAAGKLDQVKTVAFDAFLANVKALRAGRLDALVSVAALDYGKDIVQAAVDALNGKHVPSTIKPKVCVLTASNLDDPANKPCLYSGAPQ